MQADDREVAPVPGCDPASSSATLRVGAVGHGRIDKQSVTVTRIKIPFARGGLYDREREKACYLAPRSANANAVLHPITPPPSTIASKLRTAAAAIPG